MIILFAVHFSACLEAGNVFENERIVDGNLSADLVVHGVDVCLVNGHALLRQGRSVVNGDLVKLRVLAPVLVENKQKFLCATQCEYWNQTAAASIDDVMHQAGESSLTLFTFLVNVGAVSRFLNASI